MNRAEIIACLCEIESLRATDTIAAQEASRAFVANAAAERPRDSELLRGELLAVVASAQRVGHMNIWETALTVLTEFWGREIAPELCTLVLRSSNTIGWKQQVILAVLNLKYVPAAELAAEFVESRAAERDIGDLLIAAAMVQVDSERSVRLVTSRCSGPGLCGGAQDRSVRAQTVMTQYLAFNGSFVVPLVKNILANDAIAGREFAEDVLKYLKLPFVKKEFPGSDTDGILETIGRLIQGQMPARTHSREQ